MRDHPQFKSKKEQQFDASPRSQIELETPALRHQRTLTSLPKVEIRTTNGTNFIAVGAEQETGQGTIQTVIVQLRAHS